LCHSKLGSWSTDEIWVSFTWKISWLGNRYWRVFLLKVDTVFIFIHSAKETINWYNYKFIGKPRFTEYIVHLVVHSGRELKLDWSFFFLLYWITSAVTLFFSLFSPKQSYYLFLKSLQLYLSSNTLLLFFCFSLLRSSSNATLVWKLPFSQHLWVHLVLWKLETIKKATERLHSKTLMFVIYYLFIWVLDLDLSNK
jgi:hypothetical protein